MFKISQSKKDNAVTEFFTQGLGLLRLQSIIQAVDVEFKIKELLL